MILIMNKLPDDEYHPKIMERTTASILFLDLQGFSSLSESEVKCFFEDSTADYGFGDGDGLSSDGLYFGSTSVTTSIVAHIKSG